MRLPVETSKSSESKRVSRETMTEMMVYILPGLSASEAYPSLIK